MGKHEMWGKLNIVNWKNVIHKPHIGFLWSTNVVQEKEKLKFEDLGACF